MLCRTNLERGIYNTLPDKYIFSRKINIYLDELRYSFKYKPV
jgi:hypothetical protein